MQEKSVGQNIKEIRKSLNLTQENFAKKLNVSRSCVNHWENDETIPNAYMIKNMKKVLDVTYEDILDG